MTDGPNEIIGRIHDRRAEEERQAKEKAAKKTQCKRI
jgi:hypothetical protein